MAKKQNTNRDEVIAIYEKVVTAIPGLERKGDTLPYTSLNGNMFSMVDSEGNIVLRLPKDALDAFMKKHNAKLQEAYGVVRKEYAVVPDKVARDMKELKKYFAMSYEYALTLKSKPTKKPKEK